MTGVLDEYPLDFSRSELRATRGVLARMLCQPRELEDLVLAAGLNPGEIDFGGNAVFQLRSNLAEARAEEQQPALLDVGWKMRAQVGPRLHALHSPRPVLEPGHGQPEHLSGNGANWKDFGGERLIMTGNDTLLEIAFLSTGIERGRSICRITATFGLAGVPYGTRRADRVVVLHHRCVDASDGDGAAYRNQGRRIERSWRALSGTGWRRHSRCLTLMTCP